MKPGSLENYYKHFSKEGDGVASDFLFKTVLQNRDKFPLLFERLESKNPLKVLVLGSATARNLDYLSAFLDGNRSDFAKDKVIIIDKQALTLDKHANSLYLREPQNIE